MLKLNKKIIIFILKKANNETSESNKHNITNYKQFVYLLKLI